MVRTWGLIDWAWRCWKWRVSGEGQKWSDVEIGSEGWGEGPSWGSVAGFHPVSLAPHSPCQPGFASTLCGRQTLARQSLGSAYTRTMAAFASKWAVWGKGDPGAPEASRWRRPGGPRCMSTSTKAGYSDTFPGRGGEACSPRPHPGALVFRLTCQSARDQFGRGEGTESGGPVDKPSLSAALLWTARALTSWVASRSSAPWTTTTTMA